MTGDRQVRLALRHASRDGTTALEFDPVALLGRLAVLVPRPRINLLLLRRAGGSVGVADGGRSTPGDR